MAFAPRMDRAVRYACAVCADLRISRLPVDPFALGQGAGITIIPLSTVLQNPGWFPEDLPSRMQMNNVLTLTYPAFCIVFRDNVSDPNRLRFPLCHELGHLFMNHYRDFPELMEPGRMPDSSLEAEADAFARNLLAPVPIVDVIRFNRPHQAKGSVFGLPRNTWVSRLDLLESDRSFVDEDMANTFIWLFRDYLLGRRCQKCGAVFTDTRQDDRCPDCGAEKPDWNL
jgi:Zn-dependent peptidase ImmA (M78 family)